MISTLVLHESKAQALASSYPVSEFSCQESHNVNQYVKSEDNPGVWAAVKIGVPR